MTDEPQRLIRLTPSRAELGMRCYRRHALRDALRRSRFRAASLAFGSVVHAAVGEWWRPAQRSETERWQACHASLIAAWNAERIDDGRHTLELAEAMLTHYVQHAALAGPLTGDDWRLLLLEERLVLPRHVLHVGERTEASFKLDRLVTNANGDMVVIDTKTARFIDRRWREQWEWRSLQLKLYAAAVRALYGVTPFVVVEGLGKDKRTLEYVLCPEWSEYELDEAVQMMQGIALSDEILLLDLDGDEQLEAAVGAQYNYQDCFSYNVPCEYLALCALGSVEARVEALKEFPIQEEEEDV